MVTNVLRFFYLALYDVRTIHLGRPTHEIPFMWNLWAQCKMAAKTVIDGLEFAHLQSMFMERRNPLATRLHFALAKREDAILQKLCTALQAQMEGSTCVAFMFDGMVAKIPDGKLDQLKEV